MLIDSNAYVGNWPYIQLRYNTLDGLLARMSQFRTDISIISNLNGIFYKNTQNANKELYQWVNNKRIYRDRFILFGVINPRYGGWRDDLKSCIDNWGVKGVRLYPKYHGYELIDPSCIEIVKTCRDHEIPVVFSMRMVDSRPSSWMDINEEWSLEDVMPIIKIVPDAKYILVNFSSFRNELTEEDIDLIRKTELLIDTSGRSMNDLYGLIQRFGVDKFCFGTHSPLLDYFSGLLRIEALRDNEVNEGDKELIRSGNIKKLLDF